MRACQAEGVKGSEWISWAEGAHLISQNPSGSPTFRMIQASPAPPLDATSMPRKEADEHAR